MARQLTSWPARALVVALAVGLGAAVATPGAVHSGPTFVIEPPYDVNYSLSDLGSVPGVPFSYGGLTFLAGDPNTLLIGGEANDATGDIYSIGVTRDGDGHVTGFTGTATLFSDGAFIDGGLAYGPGGVLFYTRYDTNEIGQIEPGSNTTDRVVDLTPLGITSSVGTLAFVPAGHPNPGQLKIASYDGDTWYSAAIAPDGTGTYDITSATLQETFSSGPGPEGIVYVPPGSPDFPAQSMLISEYSSDAVGVYQYDANGDPIDSTRADFIANLSGAEGAVIDPITGDFLFSTFGTDEDTVIVVEGFVPPPPEQSPTPTATEPSSTEEPPEATPSATVGAVGLPETGTGAGSESTLWWPVAAIFGLSGVAITLGFARIRASRVR
ncbi:MAG: hypothetical protein WEE64_02520 [Dehalococcoidia bacterium]